MSRLDDLRATGIVACAGCERPFADVVPITVGATFGTAKTERVPLCVRCVRGVLTSWTIRRT